MRCSSSSPTYSWSERGSKRRLCFLSSWPAGTKGQNNVRRARGHCFGSEELSNVNILDNGTRPPLCVGGVGVGGRGTLQTRLINSSR
jgi:hypothetical protein